MRVPRWLVSIAGSMLFSVVWAIAPLGSIAFADAPTLAGTWSAGPVAETVTVTSWVDECGPRPKAQGLAGGTYKITTSGDELVFSGGQSFRTDACFLQEDTRRVSHSALPSSRTWKTRCESAPGDPRKADLTSTVRAQSDDVIVLTESAHYSTTMATGTCAANVERSRTFSIIAREGAAPVASSATVVPPTSASSVKPAATKTAPPPVVCEVIGPPATVDAKPKRKIVRPGDQIDLEARVLDAAGCEVPSKVTFHLAPESGNALDLAPNGRVKVHADAEPAVVAVVVEAVVESAAFKRSTRLEVEIVTDERYQELLGSALDDAGLDETGLGEQAPSVVVSTDSSKTTVLPPPVADGKRRKLGWLAITFGSVTFFALGLLVISRRRAHARRARQPSSSLGPPAALAMPEATFVDPSPAAAVAPSSAEELARAGTSIRVCPTCGERYPGDAGFCPADGQRLVAVRDPHGPVREEGASAMGPPFTAASGPVSLGRICPVCGKRYGREAGFCGQDGAELVPLN